MTERQSINIDDLVTVLEVADEFDMGESTAWLLIKRHNLARYRRPGHGKKTFVRRADFATAYQTPVPIEAQSKKLAA